MVNKPKKNFRKPLEDDKPTGKIGDVSSTDPDVAVAMTAFEWAVKYATEMGWRIFPVPPGSKSSYKAARNYGGRNWGMTDEPNEIKKDFRKWPRAGVGLPTGEVNGIFVLEVDTIEGHGVDGPTELKKLEKKNSKLPKTLMGESPTKSVHRFYKWPGAKVNNSDSRLALGVDIRGDGGMVVAPPTETKKGHYRWVNWGQPIAEAPQWLLDLVIDREPRRQTDSSNPFLRETRRPPVETDKIRHMLSLLPNDNEMAQGEIEGLWGFWNRVAMILWVETHGAEEGRELFREWSRKNPKHTDEGTDEKWELLDSCPPDHITIGSLFHLVEKVAPGWQRQWGNDKTRAVWETTEERRAAQIRGNVEIGEEILEPTLPLIMTLKEMEERLVWVGSGPGAVVDRVTGRIRKKDTASTEYAASTYKIGTGKKEKEIPALKIWFAMPERTSVDTIAWVPGEDQICAPPEALEGTKTAFNTWQGLHPMPVPDDWERMAQPFLDHVAYLVPDEIQRRRFIQWLAHIVQHPEVLPHTSYLMVTPTTGVGRNLLASILVRVLKGHVAVGVSLPDLLEGKGFNGRLSRKLLCIVDEAREGPNSQRYQRENRLRSLITEEHRLINPKYGLQSIEKNCCRWLMFSNYLDALPFNNEDRRIEVIANPKERKPNEYYEQLYGMLEDRAFIASVRQLLMTWNISGFKPGEHATMSGAKKEALSLLKSDVEHRVDEFKEDCETPLTSRWAIEEAVRELHPNSTHLTHAISNAGMINTGRRVRDSEGHRYRVVIVDKDAWSVDMVMRVDHQVLLRAMGIEQQPQATGGIANVPRGGRR